MCHLLAGKNLIQHELQSWRLVIAPMSVSAFFFLSVFLRVLHGSELTFDKPTASMLWVATWRGCVASFLVWFFLFALRDCKKYLSIRPRSFFHAGKFAGWILPGVGQQLYDLSYADLIDLHAAATRKCHTKRQRQWRDIAFACRVICLWLECLLRAIFHSPIGQCAMVIEFLRRQLLG